MYPVQLSKLHKLYLLWDLLVFVLKLYVGYVRTYVPWILLKGIVFPNVNKEKINWKEFQTSLIRKVNYKATVPPYQLFAQLIYCRRFWHYQGTVYGSRIFVFTWLINVFYFAYIESILSSFDPLQLYSTELVTMTATFL